MTNDEMNRACAEALGWTERVFKGGRTVYAEDDECGHHPISEKYETVVWHTPECKCPPNCIMGSCITDKLPDFLHSESANAMLLDVLIKNCKVLFLKNGGVILDDWHGGGEIHLGDRKAAIVLAFIAWVKAGGKP